MPRANPDGSTSFPLACAVGHVQVIADVKVTRRSVTITDLPGKEPIEIPLPGWMQAHARILTAAYTRPGAA